ncbi:cell division protein FtsQ [Psychrobacillus psychrodurans]|uniref:cell division protein FtsQ n=1 Tax=Psychrobacillus psychrodurans TaxID=126157 RepID=UPI001F4EB8B7|nr:cell division protein FtsQ [Psychrobacillus psychrodurans]MCK1998508.1 cell division protein FtsQ [Psychrobacillus psychrodurans]
MLKEQATFTQSQKMMIFILSMSLYGLSNMFTELIPSVQLGPIELQIDCFAFIPLALCMLFHPFYAAIGAATGEIIFGELMLGQFGGIGEIEKFILFSVGMIVGGLLVRNPKSKAQVAVGAILGYGLFLVLSTIVDILKVVIGVEEFEAVPGLAESIFIVEGVEFLTDLLLTGTLFTVLPALYLVPRLYGKVEPLLGLKPRTATNFRVSNVITPKFLVVSTLLSLLAFGIALLSEMDFNLGSWEPEFVDTYGIGVIWGVICVAVICVCITLWLMMKKGREDSHDLS